MLPPRDAELVALARSFPNPLWSAADLFRGRPVPHWALGALNRLQETGLVLREPIGTCRWKYRLIHPEPMGVGEEAGVAAKAA